MRTCIQLGLHGSCHGGYVQPGVFETPRRLEFSGDNGSFYQYLNYAKGLNSDQLVINLVVHDIPLCTSEPTWRSRLPI